VVVDTTGMSFCRELYCPNSERTRAVLCTYLKPLILLLLTVDHLFISCIYSHMYLLMNNDRWYLPKNNTHFALTSGCPPVELVYPKLRWKPDCPSMTIIEFESYTISFGTRIGITFTYFDLTSYSVLSIILCCIRSSSQTVL
jgi:hypothetical protein